MDMEHYLATLTNKVFSQDLLREIILNHAVIKSGPTIVSRSTIKNLRLVNSNWLGTITKLLRKKNQPLFKLKLHKNNSINGAPFVNQNGKLLDNFVHTITTQSSPSWTETTRPTFTIKINPDYFREENRESLVKCLTSCGESILELDIAFPVNGGSLLTIFPKIELPNLRHLVLTMIKLKLRGMNASEKSAEHSYNITHFVQNILNSASSLKVLSLPTCKESRNFIPSGFKLLNLPSTLTSISIRWKLDSSDLEILLKNKLPNLVNLAFLVTNTPFEDGVLRTIFDHFRATLKTLKIVGVSYHGNLRNNVTTLISFPIMEKLETLSLYSTQCELAQPENEFPNLEMCFPKFVKLDLRLQTGRMLKKWTTGSLFTSVTKLNLQLVKRNVSQVGKENNFVQDLELEGMQTVRMTFPSVTKLELSLAGKKVCGLRYIFMEMTQLTQLKVVLTEVNSYSNSDFWDALLIGAPMSFVAGMRSTDESFWQNVELSNQTASIKMLTDLKSLSLETTQENTNQPITQIISAMSFHFAFMKMHSLMRLHLKGRFAFFVYSDAVQMWKNQQSGRVYSSS